MTRIEKKSDVEIKRKLNIFIKDRFRLGNNDNTLDDQDSFFEKGIIDSTSVLELVNYIEETFSIKVEDEEFIPDNLDSLYKLISFIKKKIGNVSK